MIAKCCLSCNYYLFLFCLLCFVEFPVVLSQSMTDPCRTPNRERGTCININRCPPLLSLLMTRPVSAESRQLLQRSQCGFEGTDAKVCCPPSTTQKPGVNLPPAVNTNGRPIEPVGPASSQNVSVRHTSEESQPPTDSEEVGYYKESPPKINAHRNLRLLPTDCGNIEDDKLIGGNKTGIYEFPWMALLAYNTVRGRRFQCGGTIITPRYILTAAHCITHLEKKTLVGVRVGEHNIDTEQDCEPVVAGRECAPPYQDMMVEDILVHPQYIGGKGSKAKYQNDIGIVRLSEPIDMTKDNVFPVCLPINSQIQEVSLDGLYVTVTGWGATENGPSSPELLKISIPIVDNQQCGRVLNGSVKDGIGFRQVCAGGLKNIDSCGGDSGGPMKYLSYVNGVLRFVQHGIVSFGSRNCGRQGIPGVYTRVAYYMDWILDNLKS